MPVGFGSDCYYPPATSGFISCITSIRARRSNPFPPCTPGTSNGKRTQRKARPPEKKQAGQQSQRKTGKHVDEIVLLEGKGAEGERHSEQEPEPRTAVGAQCHGAQHDTRDVKTRQAIRRSVHASYDVDERRAEGTGRRHEIES